VSNIVVEIKQRFEHKAVVVTLVTLLSARALPGRRIALSEMPRSVVMGGSLVPSSDTKTAPQKGPFFSRLVVMGTIEWLS
jgi:hypothetical protein